MHAVITVLLNRSNFSFNLRQLLAKIWAWRSLLRQTFPLYAQSTPGDVGATGQSLLLCFLSLASHVC